MLKLDTIHRNLHRISGSHSSTAKRWNRHSRERIALGAARYTGSCWACLKYLLLFPWFRADMTNRFARGTLALQDELGRRPTLQEVERYTRAACVLYKTILGLHYERKVQKDGGQLVLF